MSGSTPAPAQGGNRAPREERRPRERNGTETGNSRPSRQVNVTSAVGGQHAAPKKPGLFRRLTRLFTGR